MSPDKVTIIHAILNSDDLAIGVSTEDPAKPFTLAGAGEKVRMTRRAAEAVLSGMEKDWGHDAVETMVLRGLLHPRPAPAEGGAL